ncbi:reduced folate transporter isoform X2 [Cygnus atratus]|uniref:reduced folate transporter isoform X2 n=1 Tax=Cygnus atratus TaxID=8868 RepID=UPI0015D61FBA|nr:reduced folate transporter isoform X2 [Cygnus atratus]XP_035426146.1 reduced folate transporter isoform X2 [Cygnus atratus]XP_035426155.1 reduced folate transporter isoform X2 [Cygnus atratus]
MTVSGRELPSHRSAARAATAMPKQDDGKKLPSEMAPDQRWKLQVFYLCFYGFMTQIRPGESFITPYLLGPNKNFTREEVTNVITPVLSYSYMAVLVPIFLLTDYLRYKPVLVLQSLSHISIWLLLVLGTSVLAMQLMEFFYGVTMAARIAYSSYIFSLVAPSRYQRMASYSRSAVLLGVFTSSVLGQLCVTLGGVPFLTLNYVSLGFVTFGLLLTLFLERPKRSLFFNRPEAACDGAAPTELDKMAGGDGGRAAGGWQEMVLCRMLREVCALARQSQLQLWSCWWVFNSAGYYLVMYYVQILWNEIYPARDNRRVYNGGVDAASTLLGAIASFVAGHVKIRWALWSALVIGLVTAVQAGLLMLMNTTSNIWLCYAAYVLFRGSYQFLVPIAIFQIATSLSKELCALVFGVNTFFGTVLKTIITIIVADKRGLGLSVHPQFYVYFGYFTLLAAAYLIVAIGVGIQHSRHAQPPEPVPATAPVQEKSPEADATEA